MKRGNIEKKSEVQAMKEKQREKGKNVICHRAGHSRVLACQKWKIKENPISFVYSYRKKMQTTPFIDFFLRSRCICINIEMLESNGK